MATVDRREGDDDFRAEVYLKIWGWDQKKSVWALNTRIDKPHGYEGITSIAFSQGLNAGLTLQLVSAGEDGSVKVWRLRSQKVKNGEREGSPAALTFLGSAHYNWTQNFGLRGLASHTVLKSLDLPRGPAMAHCLP